MRLSKKYWGEYLVGFFSLLVIPLWWLYYPESTIRHNFVAFYVLGSQLTALVGYVLFAFSFILAARWRWMEDYFGGLDRMYQVHHHIARIALVFILIHPLMLASRWLPDDLEKFTEVLLPGHRRIILDTAVYAWWGFILLMFITLVRIIPYDKWKITHKLMGVVFIISSLHLFSVDVTFTAKPLLFIYLGLVAAGGLLAFLYKTVFYRIFVKPFSLKVTKVEHLNKHVIAIEMTPDDRLPFQTGQYFFFRFFNSALSREAHPFTVCSTPRDPVIRIIVKALGDYTQELYQHLSVGTLVEAEGPYGRFDYHNAQPQQIWIAGGVGIAPFIAWAEDLRQNGVSENDINLYYCVKKEEEATHYTFFQVIMARHPNFKIHLIREDREGFFQADQVSDIQKKEVFICGPKPMLKSILRQLRRLKTPVFQIHYENFDFG